jgi:glycosyltransferase involved in cell wall biosynthesis
MPRPLRIGINALYLIPGGVGGTEIYLNSLLEALACIDNRHEFFIYVNAETEGDDFTLRSERFHVIPCRVNARFRPYRILWEQTVFPWWLKRYRIDAVLNPGFTAPILSGRPSVTVFHDLQHKRHPEFFRWFDLPFWNLLLWLSAARSVSVIAVSEATARDVERYYPRAASKTVVIRHGVDPEFFHIGDRRNSCDTTADKYTSDRYILIVSTLHPHKNLSRVLEAFAIFLTSHSDFRLVIVGLKGFASRQLESLRDELALDDSVRFTGWIPRSELYNLFEGATAFLAPSQFEGFGMPVVEALAAGIPTACSTIPPFDEIVGSSAARFDPGSVPAIAAAMETVACDADFRCHARAAGPKQASLFDWKKTAALTLAEIEKAASKGREDPD